MRVGFHKVLVLLTQFTLFTGCASRQTHDESKVSQIIESRTGNKVFWHQDPKSSTLVEKTIHQLVQNEISCDTAIYISLINNRSLQALYEEIGISQADLVQAGLLQNPFFTASLGFPTHSKYNVSSQFSITQNFIDLFSIPLKKKYAKKKLEQTELRIAMNVIEHIARVEKAYYTLQFELNKNAYLKTIVNITQAACELTESQKEAGNISELPVVMNKKLVYNAKLALARSDSSIILLREELNTLMGLWGKNTLWKAPQKLHSDTSTLYDLDNIESLAIKNRIDLKLLSLETEALSELLGLKKWWVYTQAEIGLINEKDSEGISSNGPSIGFALPIFDHGQADRARLATQLKQKCEELTSTAVSIRSQACQAREVYFAAKERTEYLHNTVYPLQKESLNLSLGLYNVMAIGAYDLLRAKQDEIDTQLEYLQSLWEFILAKVELERVVGGKLILQSAIGQLHTQGTP